MLFSIGLLIVVVFLAYKAAPREREEDAHIHGAGQVGLLAALALFGVDYFTSYYYATGELMSSLHPYGLQRYAYILRRPVRYEPPLPAGEYDQVIQGTHYETGTYLQTHLNDLSEPATTEKTNVETSTTNKE